MSQKEEFIEIAKKAIALLRDKLLDLSNRNNLINLSFNPRSNRIIRIIDELPNQIYQQLLDGNQFEIISLPPPPDEYEDEKTEEYLTTYELAKLNDEIFLDEVEKLGENYDESNKESIKIIRDLKDRVREKLNLSKRIHPDTISIEEYARAHEILPNYEMPIDNIDVTVDKHQDQSLQTLFYPIDLQRKIAALQSQNQKFIDEKGTSTLKISFGCLEWKDANNQKRTSPILVFPVNIFVKKPDKKGGIKKFFIRSAELELILNLTLQKRMERDFGITLPEYEEGTMPEEYFKLIKDNVLNKKTDWRLKRYINIAIHTYSKLSMYDDLDPAKWKSNGSILGSQKNIIDLFTGTPKEDSIPSEYDLDDKFTFEKVPLLIEEADSSQYSTILDVLKGRNLVIQGPPGTGKSTTIANLIASLMYEKKKVLFLAEKTVALDVVYKKLADKDLDPFIFKLSKTNEKRSDFINELKKRLETQKSLDNSGDVKILSENYHRQVKKISDYKKILIKEYFSIKKTGYQILLGFAKYNYQEDKYPKYFKNSYLEEANNIDKDFLFKIYGSIENVTKLINNFKTKYNQISAHPWFGVRFAKNNPFEIDEFKNKLKEINNLNSKCINELNNIYEKANLSINYDQNKIKENISQFLKINKENVSSPFLKKIKNIDQLNLLNLFYNNLYKVHEFKLSEKQISNKFDLNENFEISKLEKYVRFINNSNFLSFLFDKNYKEAKNYYKSVILDGKFSKIAAKKNLNSLIFYLNHKLQISSTIEDLNNNFKDLENIFLEEFKGSETNIDIVELIFNFISDENSSFPQKIIICNNIDNLDELINLTKSFFDNFNILKQKLTNIDIFIDENFFKFTENIINLKLVKDKISIIDFENKEELNEFIQFNSYYYNLDKILIKIYKAFLDENIDFNLFKNAFNYLLFKTFAKNLFDEEPQLSELITLEFQDEIKKYKDLDIKLFSSKINQLTNNLLNVIPAEGIGRGAVGNYTELSLLNHEISKQKKHISHRQLLKRASNALRDIKPCYMLSPISLSEITDPKENIFDVLIIDEASQMRVEDALGAILRSKQIVIVGDPEQLPPSSFFDSKNIFEGEGVVEDDESILDLAISKYKPKRMLKWHYRSKHESLINFSNYYFYGNGLIIPPSANDKFAINNHFIKGYYNPRTKELSLDTANTMKGGVNIIECESISKGVIEFMKRNPFKSSLVVTMNKVQTTLIEDTIRLKIDNNIEAQDYVNYWEDTMEPFRVKNLENVQGDERDYIFISTLFGPEKEGMDPKQRFGPIVNVKGHRRLNVLFTRAKEGVELYTSLKSNQIKYSANSERGKLIFSKYLEYAVNQKIESGIDTGKETDSDFEDWVKHELETFGYEVIPQVGVSGFFIDLGIKHKDYPYGYLAGVECDGATYHSSACARDNDITRQKVLENYGWNIYRIWSTNWFQDSQKELQKLDSYLRGIISSQQSAN